MKTPIRILTTLIFLTGLLSAQIPSGFVQTTATVPVLAGGSFGASWTNLSSSPQLGLLGCVSTFQNTVSGGIDSYGHFSILLADTAQICPAPSTWTFTFSCPVAVPGSFQIQVAVTGGGGTEDISTQITAALPAGVCSGHNAAYALLSGATFTGPVSLSTALPQPSYGAINAYGDSLLNPITQDGGIGVCARLATLSGLTVNCYGVSGNTSAQILARMTASPPAAGTLNLIWACTNDPDPSLCLPDIDSMVALVVAHNAQYLIMSPLNSDITYYHSPIGDPATGINHYPDFPTDAQYEKEKYPSNFIDIHEQLVQQYTLTTPGDQGSWAWDMAPPSQRARYSVGTLVGGIDNVTCTISVSAVGTLGNFSGMTLQLGSEVIFATTTDGSGNVSACKRGYEGTTAASHLNGIAATVIDNTHLSSAVGYAYVASQVYAWMLSHPSTASNWLTPISVANGITSSSEASVGTANLGDLLQRCNLVYGAAVCSGSGFVGHGDQGQSCVFSVAGTTCDGSTNPWPFTIQHDGNMDPGLTLLNNDAAARNNTIELKNQSNIWKFGLAGSSGVNLDVIDVTNSNAVVLQIARTTDLVTFPAAAGVGITGPLTTSGGVVGGVNRASVAFTGESTAATSAVVNHPFGYFTFDNNVTITKIELTGINTAGLNLSGCSPSPVYTVYDGTNSLTITETNSPTPEVYWSAAFSQAEAAGVRISAYLSTAGSGCTGAGYPLLIVHYTITN
jgi:hypothetical protein